MATLLQYAHPRGFYASVKGASSFVSVIETGSFGQVESHGAIVCYWPVCGLFINSWGTEWVEGPTRLDQPVGSFWADAEVIDSMLSYEDSFALSNYIGYPRRFLDYRFW